MNIYFCPTTKFADRLFLCNVTSIFALLYINLQRYPRTNLFTPYAQLFTQKLSIMYFKLRFRTFYFAGLLPAFFLLAAIPAIYGQSDASTSVIKPPVFKGCENLPADTVGSCTERKMLESIYRNIRYPGQAREEGDQGTMVVQFTITKTGEVADIDVKKSISNSCKWEVIRVVKEMPRWIPATVDGEPVDVVVSLPFEFRLDGVKLKKRQQMEEDAFDWNSLQGIVLQRVIIIAYSTTR